MELTYFANTDELVSSVSKIILTDFRTKKRRLKMFFPAGRTPRELYLAFSRDPKTWKDVFEVLQIDEFRGQPIFSSELRDLVVEPLQISDHFRFIDCNWTTEEMVNHVGHVIDSGIDGAMLGIGPNGHIGFHEPGHLSNSFLGGALEISQESLSRVPGALRPEVLTFGAGAFLKADYVILIIKGENKKAALDRFLKEPPTAQMPATLLKQHDRLYVLVDKNLN